MVVFTCVIVDSNHIIASMMQQQAFLTELLSRLDVEPESAKVMHYSFQ